MKNKKTAKKRDDNVVKKDKTGLIEARKLAFFAMFSSEAGNRSLDDTLRDTLQSPESDELRVDIARKVLTWKKNSEKIDEIIKAKLRKGKISDLGNVARTALRLGICEMEFLEDIPPAVAIHETVKLARTYGDPAIGRFVNGLMDARLKEIKSENIKGDKDEEGAS